MSAFSQSGHKSFVGGGNRYIDIQYKEKGVWSLSAIPLDKQLI